MRVHRIVVREVDEAALIVPDVLAVDGHVVTHRDRDAPSDADVWDPAAFVGSTHVTASERAALAELRTLGLVDVVPRAMKYDTPYTYWDYRAGMFQTGPSSAALPPGSA